MKKVLIIFPDEWASYSPTILNLVELLNEKYSVNVVGFGKNLYNNKNLDSNIFDLKKIPYFIQRLSRFFLLDIYKLLYLFFYCRKFDADYIIGVDNIGALAAQYSFFDKYFYLSLEVKRNWLYKLIDVTKIKALIIQTKERKEFLFDDISNLKTIYIQNAPIIKNTTADIDIDKRLAERKIIFFGNICPEHGVIHCIKAIAKNIDFTLHLKGIITERNLKILQTEFEDLFLERRLVVDKSYIKQEELFDYLNNFTLGFCFYDFDLIKKNDFNYISSPSGKLFNYYMSGVPVIASDILGLESVRKFNAGILLNEYSPDKINCAIGMIIDNYSEYVENCLNAANCYDFKKAYKRFEELLNDTRL